MLSASQRHIDQTHMYREKHKVILTKTIQNNLLLSLHISSLISLLWTRHYCQRSLHLFHQFFFIQIENSFFSTKFLLLPKNDIDNVADIDNFASCYEISDIYQK